VQKYRKSSQFDEGKSAIMGLNSKISQIKLMIWKVEEFIMCIENLKITCFVPKMQEKEIEIQRKMFELNVEYENNRLNHSKNLSREMNAIKTEIRDSSITKRVIKCHEYIKLIQDLDKDNHLQIVEILQSVVEKCKMVHGQYSDKLESIFSTDNLSTPPEGKNQPIGQAEVNVVATALAEKGVTTPKPSTPSDKASQKNYISANSALPGRLISPPTVKPGSPANKTTKGNPIMQQISPLVQPNVEMISPIGICNI
jgi:hypothetical protein